MIGIYGGSFGFTRSPAAVFKVVQIVASAAAMAKGWANTLPIRATEFMPMAGLATPTTNSVIGAFA